MPSDRGGVPKSAGHRAPDPKRGKLTPGGTRIAVLAAITATASVVAVAAIRAKVDANLSMLSARWSVTVTSPARATVISTSVQSIAVLGDSVPAAAGCDCVGFGDLLASVAASASSGKANLLNASRDGMTSTGLLSELDDANPAVQSALAAASIVTVTIGANDFDESRAQTDGCGGATNTACYAGQLSNLSSTMQAVIDRIRALTPADAHLLVTGYWNVFLDGEVGAKQGPVYVRTSDALTRAVNAVIQRAAAHCGATYVDLYGPFKGAGDRDDTPLLAADGDHPSEAGHRLIAAVLARAIGLNPAGVTGSGLRWGTD